MGTAVDAPVLGIDVGRVGFLTEVTTAEIRRWPSPPLVAGTFQVDERLALDHAGLRPLGIPTDLHGLMKYTRSPALPPPGVRDHTETEAGWGVRIDVDRLERHRL
jgi:NAD+ kinase